MNDNPNERPLVEAHRSILGILFAQQADDVGVLWISRLDQVSDPADQQIGQTLPVVGVIVDDQRNFRLSHQVADPAERAGRNDFGLLVERNEETVSHHDEADRHDVRSAAFIRSREMGHPVPDQEAALA